MKRDRKPEVFSFATGITIRDDVGTPIAIVLPGSRQEELACVMTQASMLLEAVRRLLKGRSKYTRTFAEQVLKDAKEGVFNDF